MLGNQHFPTPEFPGETMGQPSVQPAPQEFPGETMGEQSGTAAAPVATDQGFPGETLGEQSSSSPGDTSGDDTVICSELHRQGLRDEATWRRDQAFGRSGPPAVRAGYLFWAPTVVGWMRASKLMTWLVARVALPWAREMAYGDSLAGRVIMRVGWAVCSRLGQYCGAPPIAG